MALKINQNFRNTLISWCKVYYEGEFVENSEIMNTALIELKLSILADSSHFSYRPENGVVNINT